MLGSLDSLLISSLSSSVSRKALYVSSLLAIQLASTWVAKTGKPFLTFSRASYVFVYMPAFQLSSRVCSAAWPGRLAHSGGPVISVALLLACGVGQTPLIRLRWLLPLACMQSGPLVPLRRCKSQCCRSATAVSLMRHHSTCDKVGHGIAVLT